MIDKTQIIDELMRRTDPNFLNSVVKEAIKEFLRDLMKDFGIFSLKFLMGCAAAGFLYLALVAEGWHK